MKTDFKDIQQFMIPKMQQVNIDLMNKIDGILYVWMTLDSELSPLIDGQLSSTIGHTFKTVLKQKPEMINGFDPDPIGVNYTKVFDEDGERDSLGIFI